MQFVDAHCHFDFPRFDGCREQELARARESGLVGLVIPGVRRADWSRVRETALGYSGLYYCLGIHPWYVDEHQQSDIEDLAQLLRESSGRCLAVGECGLDRLHGSLADQWPWFEAQIALASELTLPLVIHSVRTHDDVHGALKRAHWNGRALIHGFSGSYQQASKLVDLGCYIGVGGVITYPRARKTRETMAKLPLNALLLETDAPDMAPEGVERGRNSPVHLLEIIRALAELRGIRAETLTPVLLENAERFYGRRWSV